MKARNRCLLSLLAICVAMPSFAAEKKKSPRDILLSIVRKRRRRHLMPAVGAAVIIKGKLAAVATDGFRASTKKVAVTDNDLFHIGSCTKAMTATLIAKLVEQGKLKWESTLPELLPKMAKLIHPELRQVTLEHLLSHQSGLVANIPKGKSFAKLHDLKGSPRKQRMEYAKMLLAAPPLHKLGTKYAYSNAGYALTGVIAEETMNLGWEELMEKHVFAPLKMTRVGHGSMGTPGKIDQPWQHRSLLGLPIPVQPGPRSDNPVAIGPAGRVHCSLTAWSKFVAAHLAGARGKSNLLKKETFKRLQTPKYGGSYACGWLAVKRNWAGGTALNHAGSNTMNFAVTWIAPKKNFAVLIVTNHGGGFALCDGVATDCIGAFLMPKKKKNQSTKK